MTATTAPKGFDALPDDTFVRIDDLAKKAKSSTVPVPLPFTHSTLWRKVRAGDFPAPTKLGERITAWRVGDIRAWLNAKQAGSAN